MPITKFQLNNIHELRDLLAEDIVKDLKKHLINHALLYFENKQYTYTYSFELGQDLLIERIVQVVKHELVNMVNEEIIVYYDHYLNRDMMLLKLVVNWEFQDAAFVMDDYQE